MTEPTRLSLPLTTPTGAATAAAAPDTCSDGCCIPPNQPADQGSADRSPGWAQAARRARALSWASLLWMTAEGVLGLVAGIQAQSISLLGWALGSVIEGLASVIVIWRLTGSRTHSETAEARAQKAVAVSFFLLAPYIAIEAVRDLIGGHHATTTSLGVSITVASLPVMPLLGGAKQRLGRTLNSGSTAGEGTQNLICAAQAAAVLIGIAATATLGWSWADPAIALLLAGWAVKEGIEAWQGNVCC